jgi:MtrB/PioB family decaheme-associated outer membrane protein
MNAAPSSPALRTVLAMAALSACGAARADASDTVAQTTVQVGVGVADGDRALAGQYDLIPRRTATLLLGVDQSRHDPASGVSMRLSGANLPGEARELDVRWKRQGDWAVRARIDEQVRHEPLRVGAAGQFDMKRTGLGVNLSKVLGSRWQLDLAMRSEDKEGSRLFGIGFTCPSTLAPDCGPPTGTQTGWALLSVSEPIRSRHSQAEMRMSYGGASLRFSVGYLGSFYQNHLDRLDPVVPASLNNPLGVPMPLSPGLQAILSQPVALPPDNQYHRVDVAGTLTMTPTTHLTFKLARGRATQQQDFTASGFTTAPAGVTDLGGRIDTTLAQVGLTARPLPKVSVRAQLRHEDRDDGTPLAAYNVEGSETYTNRRLPQTRWRAQLHASYQFDTDHRATLGAEHEAIDRGVFTASSAVAGLSALRQKTDETTLRAELRRRVDESISGAVSVASSRRGGSNWLRDNSGRGVTEITDPTHPSTGFATAIFMPTLADRDRDTLKLQADWQPTQDLALQLSAQSGRDRFRTPSAYGLRRTGHDQLGLDASYTLSPKWSLHAHLLHGEETLRQARPAAALLSFDNRSIEVGLGATGKPSASLELGGTIGFIDDRSVYRQTLDPTADVASAALLAASGGLPDIVFRQTRLSLYGRHALDKRSAVRVDLVHQRSRWTDWAWAYNGVPFVYSDGSTVGQATVQAATWVGLTYSISWR